MTLYTGWSISHATDKKIEYLPYGLSTEADFFTNDRGMFKLYIHMDTVEKNLC